jgi:superfamily II DNA/RNA helicase
VSRQNFGGTGTRRDAQASRGAARRRTSSSTRPSSAQPAPKARSAWDDLAVQVAPSENLPSFAELGLPQRLVHALTQRGIPAPFPIQAATMPDALAGRDVLGRAATGSGKTLAFGLPMIVRLTGASARPRRPRGLVLVPTRELAMQVADGLTPLAQAQGLSIRLVAGGLPIQKQIQSLVKGVDLLVATPGRLEDLISRRACELDHVEITVLDEADHMADLGFLPVVTRLLEQTPADGQRLLFSATLDGGVSSLVERFLTNPSVHAAASAEASVDTMTHHLFRVPFEEKADLVANIAAREGRTILFVRTKHGADRVARNLRRVGVHASAIHGGRTQAQRNQALNSFRDGSAPVLVATDVAARGIHVDDVSLVLHVDPPADPKDYLHRSGRTARAGADGVVVLLATPTEERDVQKMLNAAGVRPEQRDVRAGDDQAATIAGARKPSGKPIVVVTQKQAEHRAKRAAAKSGKRPTQKSSQTVAEKLAQSAEKPRGRGGQRPSRPAAGRQGGSRLDRAQRHEGTRSR